MQQYAANRNPFVPELLQGRRIPRAKLPPSCMADPHFRKLLEDKDIDVVSLATPNHWHALQTIWALAFRSFSLRRLTASVSLLLGAVPYRTPLLFALVFMAASQWVNCIRPTARNYFASAQVQRRM